MKCSVLAAILVALLPAAGEAATTPEENAALVDAYLAAWNREDAKALAEFYAPDASFDDMSGHPLEGRSAIIKELILPNFEGLDTEWTRQGPAIATADAVVFEYTFSGVNNGSFGPEMPATNRSFGILGATIFHIENGLIVRHSEYFDTLGYYEQLGWLTDE